MSPDVPGDPLPSTNNILYVAVHGDDATAVANRPDRPWQTWSNAIAAALSGDLIQVEEGVWTVEVMPMSFGPDGAGPVPIIAKTNLVLQGRGTNTVLFGPGNGCILPIWNSSNVVLRQFALQGTRQNASNLHAAIGLWGDNTRLRFEDLTFTSFPDHIIDCENDEGNNAVDVVVRGCRFEDWGYCYDSDETILPADGSAIVPGGHGWLIENNVFRNGVRGVETWSRGPTNLVRDVIVRSNLFEQISWQGVVTQGRLENHRGLQIYDNVFRNFKVPADQIGYLTNAFEIAAIAVLGGRDIRIENNQVEEIRGWWGHPVGHGRGIVVWSAAPLENVIVRSNRVTGCKDTGVSVWEVNYPLTRVVIDRNLVISNGAAGIALGGGRYHLVAGNSVIENGQVDPVHEGIKIEGGLGHRIMGNTGSSGESLVQYPDLWLGPLATNTLIARNLFRSFVDLATGTQLRDEGEVYKTFTADAGDQVSMDLRRPSALSPGASASVTVDVFVLGLSGLAAWWHQVSLPGSISFVPLEGGLHSVLVMDGSESLEPQAVEVTNVVGPRLVIAFDSGDIVASWSGASSYRLEATKDFRSGTWVSLDPTGLGPNGERLYRSRPDDGIGVRFFRLMRAAY